MSKKLVSFAIAAMLTATAFAAPTPDNDKKPETIHQRKINQQRRIHQGVKNDQLTKHETRHVEKKERALNREERQMRAKNGGKLTKQDRKVLNRQQNHISKQIYKDKHNNRKRG